MKRHWTDQPQIVEEAKVLARFFLKGPGVTVEVRQIGYNDGMFITTGNLFGSQTIRVVDHQTAFRLIGAVAELESSQEVQISRFPGVEIVEEVSA